MTEVEHDQPIDGRAARRERNIQAALDAAIGMFGEGELFPTVEQVSNRSGISVRSLYRYFADPSELHDAAIKRHREKSLPLAHLPSIGEGPLNHRIDQFVAMRLRLFAGIEAAYRAAVHNAVNHAQLRDQVTSNRNDLRQQFERQFAPELLAFRGAERQAVLAAGDLLTQLDSIDLLRRHRQLTVAETAETLTVGLRALLAGQELLVEPAQD